MLQFFGLVYFLSIFFQKIITIIIRIVIIIPVIIACCLFWFYTVSGPIANIHAPIARSKSVQSMLSLRDPRDQRAFTRESSSKDSSNGEEDAIMGDAAEMMMSAKDRRVTFRNAAAAERRLECGPGVRSAASANNINYPLRKCASVSFQHSSSIEKRLRMLAYEN